MTRRHPKITLQDALAAEEAIRSETAPEAGVMVIGPAGENKVRFACINADHPAMFLPIRRWLRLDRSGGILV